MTLIELTEILFAWTVVLLLAGALFWRRWKIVREAGDLLLPVKRPKTAVWQRIAGGVLIGLSLLGISMIAVTSPEGLDANDAFSFIWCLLWTALGFSLAVPQIGVGPAACELREQGLVLWGLTFVNWKQVESWETREYELTEPITVRLHVQLTDGPPGLGKNVNYRIAPEQRQAVEEVLSEQAPSGGAASGQPQKQRSEQQDPRSGASAASV